METTKHRYSDTDLQDFKWLIQHKLSVAKEELASLSTTLSQSDSDGAFHTLEDGAAMLEKKLTIKWLAVKRNSSTSWKLLWGVSLIKPTVFAARPVN